MSGEGTGLQQYLAGLETRRPGAVWRISRPVNIVHQVTALQSELWRADRHPIVVIENPLLGDGTPAAWPLVVNLTASRELCVEILGTTSATAAADLASAGLNSVDPIRVRPDQAPVREVVCSGDEIDLTRWPACLQHVYDPGPYLAAAHACTYDPDTGVDNTAIQRCWVRAPRLLGYFPYPSSHNWKNILKWWNRGEDAPVALWIGHHPAIGIASNAKLEYGQSHWPRAGAMAGQAVRLVPTVNFGEQLMVPADAEIIVEGVVPRNRFAAEGPFGEYTGYSGPQRPSPLLEILTVTHRKAPMQHEYASGMPDMLIPDNLLMEAHIYGLVKPVAPSLITVHVPVSGRRMHAYLQFQEPRHGEVERALDAALAYRRVKHAIAVDEDIDIFDEREVMWAIATRVQFDRDMKVLRDMEASLLDPSLPPRAQGTTKAGIDATLPAAAAPGLPRPCPPPSRVPAEVLRAMRLDRWLDGVDSASFPAK